MAEVVQTEEVQQVHLLIAKQDIALVVVAQVVTVVEVTVVMEHLLVVLVEVADL